MKNILLFVICLYLSSSCKTNNHEIQVISNINEVGKYSIDTSLVYTYEDSISIGERKKYRLSVNGYLRSSEIQDTLLLKINLLERVGSDWICNQNLTDTIYGIVDPEIEITDINDDGLNDFNFKYALSGRGYNELRKYYLFDKKKKQFIGIKNSSKYPNLSYNKDLDCIESHIGHGGYSTVFLEIETDSMREFSTIDMYDKQRIVSILDTKGEITIIDRIEYDLDTEDADIIYGDYDYHQLKKYKNQNRSED